MSGKFIDVSLLQTAKSIFRWYERAQTYTSDTANTNAIGGDYNVGIGMGAIKLNTADANTAIGYQALFSNISGYYNTGNGTGALYSNIAVGNNNANGFYALYSNITGSGNTATGSLALITYTGTGKTATGTSAIYSNTTGTNNTATGSFALRSNTNHNSFVNSFIVNVFSFT